MKFEYTGRHIEVTPAIRTHLENHFTKLSPLFKNNEVEIHAILSVEKSRQIAELNVKWRDRKLNVKDSNKDMYHAITKAVEKVEKQAVKNKSKKVTQKQTATKRSMVAQTFEKEVEAAPLPPKIINARRYQIKPMTSEEAVITLQAEKENQFIVFRDAETESFSVIYKRKDGNFGLIQP
jgi:putative sigma-54 modulation protein